MTWCLVGLLSLLAQDPQPQQSGFEIVDMGPGQTQTKKAKTSSRAVPAKGKPIEIKMPKKKKGEMKFQKPKKR